MELIINKSDLRNTSIEKPEEYFKPGGILNSSYHQIANKNLSKFDLNTVSGIRNKVLSRTFYHSSSIETILKVSVFLILLGMIL